MANQINTGKTSRNVVPTLFKLVKNRFGWNKKDKILDYGAGKFKKMEEALMAEGVEYYCRYDKYNKKENPDSLKSLLRIDFDIVLLSNVLNTIPTLDEQITCVSNANMMLGKRGTVYATVYEGDKQGKYEITRDGFQHNLPTSSYIPLFEKHGIRWKSVERYGKLIVVEK